MENLFIQIFKNNHDNYIDIQGKSALSAALGFKKDVIKDNGDRKYGTDASGIKESYAVNLTELANKVAHFHPKSTEVTGCHKDWMSQRLDATKTGCHKDWHELST